MSKDKLPQLPLPGEEALRLDVPYTIMSVEEFTSDVQNYHGVRVTLDGGADDLLAIPLWWRETVGRSSKFGSFIVELGDEPEAWVGSTIKFIRWLPKDRLIERVK